MSSNSIKLDRFNISKLFPKREQDSNKGTFGTVLNIAGSMYYPGAAYLSSIAALRSGCGLIRLASESSTINTVSCRSADITYIDLGQNEFGTIPKNGYRYIKGLGDYSSISIGPGLTNLSSVKEFVVKFLKLCSVLNTPIVIDADAINILSDLKNPELPLNSVITPHPKELSRLIKTDVSEIQNDREKWASYTSSVLNCIVVLKGHETVISIPNGKTYINTTGNSTLSKGGTGDILTGLIAGFAAQGLKLEDAVLLAVFIHGRTGEIAGKKLTEFSAIASDILNFIPLAMREFV